MARRTRRRNVVRRRRRRPIHENVHRRRYPRRNVRRRARRRAYEENYRPRRRSRRNVRVFRRRYRENLVGAPRMADPQTWMVPLLSAGTGAASAAAVARMMLGPGATPPMSYLVEAGTGLAGWMILPMTGMVRMSTGFFFFIGSAVPIVSDIVSRYIFRAFGLSAYTYSQASELGDMGQEPRFPPTLSAYAYELSDGGMDAEWGEAPHIGAYGGGSPAFAYGGAMPRAPWETAGPAGY